MSEQKLREALQEIYAQSKIDGSVDTIVRALRVCGKLASEAISQPTSDEGTRDIAAVIERLRFGNSTGDDHDLAADEIERLERTLHAKERELELLRVVCKELAATPTPSDSKPHPKPRHGTGEQMTTEELLKRFIDAVEKLAFEIPAPNVYTQRLLQLCIDASPTESAPGVEGRGDAKITNRYEGHIYYGIVNSNGRLFLGAEPCVSDSVDDLANDLVSRQYHEPEKGWHVAPVYTVAPPTDALAPQSGKKEDGWIDFHSELQSLINRYSKENGSNTPDFILAGYLENCLDVFDEAVTSRTAWHSPPTQSAAPSSPPASKAEGE